MSSTKFVGFIKQLDNIKIAEDFEVLKKIPHPSFISVEQKKKIESYLNDSTIIFSWMGYFSDIETNQLIAPHGYHSDGKWVWPSYLFYYLEKMNLWHHYKEFVEDIKDSPPLTTLPVSRAEELAIMLTDML